jgi:hypothetical protein
MTPGRQLAVWAVGVLLAMPTSLAAQQGSLTGARPPPAGADAYLQRQLRTLERGATSPESAEILLQRTQRDFTSRSRGVYLTPEQARAQRDLDRIERDLRGAPGRVATTPLPARPRGERLPGTIDDVGALPSMGGTVTLGRLVGRAESALADGRPQQARSDLAAARSLIGGASAGSPEEAAALTEIEARMDAVERTLAGGS